MLKLLQNNKAFTLCFIYSVLYFSLWTIARPIPSIDIAENFFWGQEFQLGYYKHPPLFAIVSGIFALFLSTSAFVGYLISSIFMFISFIAFYFLAREFLSKQKSIIAIILLTTLSLFMVKFKTFNANSAQTPFWILSALFYLKGVNTKHYKHFILFGFFLGLGFLNKYYTLGIAFAIFVSFITNQKSLSLLKTPLPYVAVFVFFITISPHIFWLFNNNFLPLQYAAAEQQRTCSFFQCRLASIYAFLELIIIITPLILTYFYLFKNITFQKFNLQNHKNNLLFCITTLPISITLSVLFLKGGFVKVEWFIPAIPFLPIFILYFWKGEEKGQIEDKSCKIFYFFLILWTVILIISGSNTEKRLKSRYYGVKQLALYHTQKWQEEFGTPLKFVAGNTRDAGTFYLFSKTNPSIIPDDNLKFASFINKQELAKNGYLSIKICESNSLCFKLKTKEVVKDIKKITGKNKDFYIFITYYK